MNQRTVPYTPEQKGVTERVNRTTVLKTRSMLAEAVLSKKFWAEAVNTATYLRSCSSMKAVSATPEEAWTGERVNLGHLRVFGCRSFVHIPGEKITK
jgi:hypothetical protein